MKSYIASGFPWFGWYYGRQTPQTNFHAQRKAPPITGFGYQFISKKYILQDLEAYLDKKNEKYFQYWAR